MNLRKFPQAQVYSGIDSLPQGMAPETITPGCIVLEGGAFRGLYSSGVLDALMEAGINFQTTIGVSAGAMNGVNYTAGQIGRSARINLRYRHDPRYVGLLALFKNQGIIGFDFVFGHMEGVPDLDLERFQDPHRDFYAVVTNVATGKPEFLHRDFGGNIYDAVRASASMPYVSKPVPILDGQYLDGGCSLNIPYQWAIDHGFEKILVIKTRPIGYRKPTELYRHHRPEKETLYRNHPAFRQALEYSNVRYNRECSELELLHRSGRIAMIAPSAPVTVGRLEPDMEKLGKLYYLGYEDGKREIPYILDYLSGGGTK